MQSMFNLVQHSFVNNAKRGEGRAMRTRSSKVVLEDDFFGDGTLAKGVRT